MLVRKLILPICFVTVLCGTVNGQSDRFSAGLMVGEPTGASVKAWLSDSTAIDGGIGAAVAHGGDLHLHADYLWHRFDLFDAPGARLPLYFGVGGRVRFDDDTRAGVRGPVGVAYMFDDIPVEVFGEVAPVLDFTPNVRFDFVGAIGARYRF
jgi:hypothetical protein